MIQRGPLQCDVEGTGAMGFETVGTLIVRETRRYAVIFYFLLTNVYVGSKDDYRVRALFYVSVFVVVGPGGITIVFSDRHCADNSVYFVAGRGIGLRAEFLLGVVGGIGTLVYERRRLWPVLFAFFMLITRYICVHYY